MDIIRGKDGEVGAEIKPVVAEEGPAEGEWEMNNCLTGGMKKAHAEAAPSRVLESVASNCARVIHHANTAGGHSLAQRYAEQGRIMCCACTRSI